MRLLALMVLFVPIAVSAGDLPAGAYRVRVEIVLPNIDTRDYDFETDICWQGAASPDMPLGPLGPGPLRSCASTARVVPDGVTVETACAGGNAGWAKARYRATEAGFAGRVSINLGGKNMTLGEVQRGTYLGPCPD